MNWNEYYLSLLPVIAARSKDTTKVGALIVGPANEIRSTGYNGFPRRVLESALRWQKPEKYSWVVHSEENAILNAAKNGVSTDRCQLFVSMPPCLACAKSIVQAGIWKVTVPQTGHDYMLTNPTYAEQMPIVQRMFTEADVMYRIIK